MITENKFEIEKKLINLFTEQEFSNFYTFDSFFVWLYEKAPLRVTVFKDNLYTSMEFLLMKEESKSKEHLKYNLNIGGTLEKFKNLPEFFMIMNNPVTLYKMGDAALLIMKDAFLLLEKNSCLSVIYSETKEVAIKYWRLLEWDKVIEEKEVEYWYLNRSNHSHIVPKLLKSPAVEVDINKNYNHDLPFDQITQFVESDKPGLILFNGDPGTGKSTLIKHLIALYPEKEWVLVPSIIIRIIGEGDPDSLNYFLSGSKDRVYILEDCEKLIMKREKGNDLEVFLNLTDGMLGDALCPKFICTFNTNVSNIDPALLRRGRLKLRYEFAKLSLDRTRLHLPNATSSMYLSDIYNQLDNGGEVKRNKVGFC